MKKWLKLLESSLVTTSVTAVLSTCSNNSSGNQKYDRSLSWMTTSEIQTLDQTKMVDTTSGEQADNVFEGLNRLDSDGKVKPGVATK